MTYIVAVSGPNSAIGKAVIEACSRRGIEVVKLGRRKGSTRFNLETDVPPLAQKIDGFIHLAWDWTSNSDQSHERNIRNMENFLDDLGRKDSRLVLLSTQSTEARLNSNYGQNKFLLEKEFISRGGIAIRAGLVWGAEPSGIISTLMKIARVPIACLHIKPEPLFRVSNIHELANLLIDEALFSRRKSQVIAMYSPLELKLSDILHSFIPRTQLRIHVHVNSSILYRLAQLGQLIPGLGMKLDSVRVLTAKLIKTDPINEILYNKSDELDFQNWARKAANKS
jgi:hypothetical protein